MGVNVFFSVINAQVKPYDPEFNPSDIPDDDEDWDISKGIKVLALAYVPDFTQVAFACFVGVDGEPSDYLRLSNITKSAKSPRESDRLEKACYSKCDTY